MRNSFLNQCDSLTTKSTLLKVVLNQDGSVIQLLETLFNESIIIECLGQGLNHSKLEWQEIDELEKVLVRTVFLTGAKTKIRYVYAMSMIRMDYLDDHIHESILEKQLGIGQIMNQFKMETYRELIDIRLVYNKLIHSVFTNEEFVSERQYKIYMNHIPVMLIKEYYPHSLYTQNLQ